MDCNKKTTQLPENPREKANYFSKLFFLWLFPFLWKGYKSVSLQLEDLYSVLEEDAAQDLGDRLERAWEQQCIRAKEKERKPNLLKAVYAEFGAFYTFSCFCLVVDECTFKVAQTLFLQYLVKSFAQPELFTAEQQYIYAAGFCISTFLYILILHSCYFVSYHTEMKARTALSSLVFRKSLRLSRAALNETNIGQALTILSNDVSRHEVAMLTMPYLVAGPIQLAIFATLLWEEMMMASLAGISFLLLLLPLQYLVGKYSAVFRSKAAKRIDERVGFMSEIIVGMRVIKMYAWELPFSKLINNLRKLEVRALTSTTNLRAACLALFQISTKLVVIFTVVAYVYIGGNILVADKIFFAIAIYNTLLRSILYGFPSAASGVGAILVSMTRIETYLLLNEQKHKNRRMSIIPHAHSHSVATSGEPTFGPSIQMRSASASWTKERETLTKLNVDIHGNQLVMVVGSVGSGKSAFLNTLITELPINSGDCTLKGRVSYAAQEPWIFSGNVKQNIIFGREFNAERYREVLQVCALEDDLKQWPNGDMTIVGERGVSLSGGQKARVNLARALYQEADIYLLDDPLSAVDIRVSRYIFDNCIKTHFKDKLTILVTHQHQYLPSADHIIVLKNGQILDQGSHDYLMEQNIDFLSLTTAVEKDGNQNPNSIEACGMSNESIHNGFEESEDRREEMAEGSVTLKTYWAYFKSSGSLFITILAMVGFLLTQVLLSGCEFWLARWTNKSEEVHEFNQDDFMFIYIGLIVGYLTIVLFHTLGFFKYALGISANMHDGMFENIVRAPVKFFDENPSGRIMNRFTKDLALLDEKLPETLFDTFQTFLQTIGVLVIVCMSNYYILVPTLVILVVFVYVGKFYIGTGRSVKRIEAQTRSPIFSHLTTCFQGLTTIRSSGSQNILVHQFGALQDSNSAAAFIYISMCRWLSVWLEVVSVMYLTVITFSFLFISTSTESGNVGLALTSALLLNMNLQWGIRQSADTENIMTSVERMLEYSKLKSEAPLTSDKSPDSKEWPKEGAIKFSTVSLSYGEKDVLKELTFDIKKTEKIGIVGRTGAGKSSIITALFRLTEPRGQIYIDSLLINELGLHDVRKNISIIPQEPVLFSGTMRYNLDPFNQFKDDELWGVLNEVELKDAVPALDFGVTDGGGNFSVGQRQLVCLARAILRQNKIIVMDEATSNVDPRTDEFIQKTIRRKFADCTIITIAHRLQTVMDCDRILVLEDGQLKEYDHPHNLLQNPDGYLTHMVNQLGESSKLKMEQIARDTHENQKVGKI